MSKKNNRYEYLGTLWKQSRPQHRKATCYTVDCSARCARNHLLKQKGIISKIEKHGHVRELRTDRFQDHRHYYSFKRIGWEKAMAMYGYCSNCDQRLFSRIEVPEPLVPNTAADFCRYSLRPIAHEIRKKEGNLKFLASRDGKGEVFVNHRGEYQLTKLKNEEFAIVGLKALLDEFTEGLDRRIPVTFTIRELPRIEVCASSLLIPPTGLYVKKEHLLNASKSFKGKSFNIVNLFPTDNASLLILGTHDQASQESHELQKYVKKAEVTKLSRLVSNILIAKVEDWAISDQLYSKLPNNFESLITKAKTNQFSDFDKDAEINLFDF